MRRVLTPRTRASLASWPATLSGVCVVEEPPLPVPVDDGAGPSAAVPPAPEVVVPAAPAAAGSARAAAATPARIRFRAPTAGNRRHGRSARPRARSPCTTLVRRTFSEQVRLLEIVPPRPLPRAAFVDSLAYGVS